MADEAAVFIRGFSWCRSLKQTYFGLGVGGVVAVFLFEIEPTRIYRMEDAREFLSDQDIDMDAIAPQVDGKFMSAFIRAVKPQSVKPCCGPTCCQ